MSQQKNKPTFLDVRTPEEFKSEHLPGAINIPLDQVRNRLDEIKTFRRPLIAYCRSGSRSGLAVSMLKQNGITDAINGGGISALKRQWK